MNPIPLGIYRHYKGNQYEVVGFAKHSETLEDMVVYRQTKRESQPSLLGYDRTSEVSTEYKALYGEGGTWVRPLSMWDNLIETDGKTVKRFEYVGEPDRQNELTEAHRALLSTLQKCEKIDFDKQGKSQRTLLERRIAALKIVLKLIEKEQEANA